MGDGGGASEHWEGAGCKWGQWPVQNMTGCWSQRGQVPVVGELPEVGQAHHAGHQLN